MDTLIVGTGGILGALTRFYLGKYIAVRVDSDFPWGTFIINISGAFLLSFLTFYKPLIMSNYYQNIKLLIMTGFLGAYTTFSTLSYETYQLAKNEDYKNFALYFFGSLVLGLFAAYLGMLTGKSI